MTTRNLDVIELLHFLRYNLKAIHQLLLTMLLETTPQWKTCTYLFIYGNISNRFVIYFKCDLIDYIISFSLFVATSALAVKLDWSWRGFKDYNNVGLGTTDSLKIS